jgi:E3 ubiquitin-protein ligase ZSWIM2
VFKKEKDLCKHICWVILKKFRVDRSDPLSWQLGLNEREITQMIRGDTAQEAKSRMKNAVKKPNAAPNGGAMSCASGGPNEMNQKEITPSDICPICQDELLAKKLPVTYCR